MNSPAVYAKSSAQLKQELDAAPATLKQLRRSAGLAPVAMSAKQLRATNPALADKWATFIRDNKAAIVRGIASRIS